MKMRRDNETFDNDQVCYLEMGVALEFCPYYYVQFIRTVLP